jgi:hypothetical protein
MRSTVRGRFWFEAGLASLAGLLAVLTVAWPDWIEALYGFDPDHHSGSLEWAIVVALAFVALACGLAARSEWGASVATAHSPG